MWYSFEVGTWHVALEVEETEDHHLPVVTLPHTYTVAESVGYEFDLHTSRLLYILRVLDPPCQEIR